MPSAYLIPTAGRFGRGESRKENRRTEAEICLQRHRRDGRGEESTTTPDEGSERKGVSRAQGGGEREEPRRRISRRHTRRPSCVACGGGGGRSYSRETWKSEEDGGSQFCLVGPVRRKVSEH